MLIKYHGKLCEIDTTLEEGAKEFDLLQDDVNLEDTIEFPKNFLEDTTKIEADEIIKAVKDKEYE